MYWRWRSFCYDSGENLINDKKIIAIVGSGTMGNGIAHVAALSGYLVFLVDIKKEFLDKAANTISTNLLKQLDKLHQFLVLRIISYISVFFSS